MAINRNEIRVYIEKIMVFCVRTSYRCARDHPFVFALVFFLLVLYRSFPSLFAFLVSSSPVIVCTTVLLGLLLSYGEPNIPEIEIEDTRTREVSSVEIRSSVSHLCLKKDENLTVENHVENRTYYDDIVPRETIPCEEKSSADVRIYQALEQYEGTERIDTIVGGSASGVQVKKDRYDEEVIQEEETLCQEASENRDLFVGKTAIDVAEVSKDISSFDTKEIQETEDLKLETGEPKLDHHLDSSLGLSWQSIDDHHSSSDTESDRAESSSPDASITDIIPMLDELHPLLDSEHPQHVSIPKSDAASEGSSLDDEPDDNSIDEEAEIHDEEEDDEAQEKDDGTEAAVKWTEDDQKNFMDLGSSELERNQRLESLIAKQKEKKNLSFVMDRNLIDLDVNASFPGMEKLSRFRVQVPPISAPRRNPFDVPYDSEETFDLPPMPGSAPSSLLPRRNPFDLFYDQQEQNSSLTDETWSHQDFVSAPQHEMLVRRNETFSLRRKEFKQERGHSRLKPYFVAEKLDSEEGSSTFQRQYSDRNESKVSSIPESDTDFSVTDQEYNRELEEQVFDQETELLCPGKHDADAVEHESHTSEETESVDIEQEKTEHVTDDREIGVDTNLTAQENEKVSAAGEAFAALEEDVKEEIHLDVLNLNSKQLELTEQKYAGPNSSNSSWEDEKCFKTTLSGQPHKLEQTKNFSTFAFAEFDHSKGADTVSAFADTMYDSSALAAGESFYKLSTFDARPDANQGVNDDSSVTFDMQKEDSEVASFPRAFDGNSASGIGDLVSVNAINDVGPFILSQSLTSIEENETRSSVITEITKYNDVEVELSTAQEDSSLPISYMIQEPTEAASDDHLAQSREVPINVDVSHSIEREEVIKSTPCSSDILILSDDPLSCEFQIVLPSIEKYSLPSDDIGVEKSRVKTLDFPSFFEENQDDIEHKEENSGFTNHYQVVGLTELQINEDLKVLESDTEQEAYFSQKPEQETGQTDDNFTPFHKSKDITSEFSAAVTIHDGSLAGLQLIELTESTDSIVSEMTSEVKVQSSTDLSRSRDGIKSPTLTKHEAGSLKMINSSDEESDEVHPVVLEADEIDENLPTELDELGDFHTEELTNHQGSEMMFQTEGHSEDTSSGTASSFVDDYTQLQVSEGRSILHADRSVNQSSEANFDKCQGLSSLVNQPGVMELEIHSSFASSIDPEQTVYNPKIHVLEASPVHEVGSTSNQLLEIDTAQRNMKQTVMESELLVVEARSVEDIHLAFKQISEVCPQKPVFHEAGSQNLQVTEHLDAKQRHSDMHVIEAKSIEDIGLAFSELSHNTSKKTQEISEESHHKPIHQEVGSPNFEGTEHLDAKKIQSDLHVVEAKSIDDIGLAFTELSHSTRKKAQEISEVNLHKPIYQEVGSQNFKGAEHLDAKHIQSDLHVIEAKSIEDIGLAFSGLSHNTSKKAQEINEESLHKPVYQEVGSPNFRSSEHIDAKQIQSDLHVIEAKSIADISSAFSELSHNTSNKAPTVMETVDGSVEVNASRRQLETQVVEVQSAVEIKEAVTTESNSSMEQLGEKSKVEIVGDVSASKALTTSRTQKKHKRRQTVSSSSSSSSDSDFHESEK
ncbi:uncharacterized protein LOC103971045 isoform X1 [Musa acuminata AAA Group]|uniref:uncharacterized protein LOC103971045 isoform X1 n=1 Tax=Musa acuminata AAA Group TaxID=214697 RepID=UPI0031D8BD95